MQNLKKRFICASLRTNKVVYGIALGTCAKDELSKRFKATTILVLFSSHLLFHWSFPPLSPPQLIVSFCLSLCICCSQSICLDLIGRRGRFMHRGSPREQKPARCIAERQGDKESPLFLNLITEENGFFSTPLHHWPRWDILPPVTATCQSQDDCTKEARFDLLSSWPLMLWYLGRLERLGKEEIGERDQVGKAKRLALKPFRLFFKFLLELPFCWFSISLFLIVY